MVKYHQNKISGLKVRLKSWKILTGQW